MRIINQERLIEFAREHREAKSALLRWAAIARVSQWQTPIELRNTFRSADQVCECTVFNIVGNNFRLIARIYYADQTVALYYFLNHKEYVRGRWKKDCDC